MGQDTCADALEKLIPIYTSMENMKHWSSNSNLHLEKMTCRPFGSSCNSTVIPAIGDFTNWHSFIHEPCTSEGA